MSENKIENIYTEIVKIIEGGLKKDSSKVAQYAKKIIEKLEPEGNAALVKAIKNILANRTMTSLTMDSLTGSMPVDIETGFNIVDIFNPETAQTQIILPENLQSRVNEFINIIEHKNKLKAMDISLQSSLLLYGAPGVGKTTIAKYISIKTGLPLLTARLDSLVSSLLGSTAKNLRKIFDYADSKPCILFLDEFDAIAKARDDQHELGELKRVINSLLQNIDHFTEGNILIAATNHPELLDKAIWRRFNTVIEVNQLKGADIRRIIQLYLGNFGDDYNGEPKKYDKVVNVFSTKTPSDIRSIINNAITRSVIEDKKHVSPEDLLIENFNFDTHGKFTKEELIKYLNENGISQAQIAEMLDLSIRQIRNNLKEN